MSIEGKLRAELSAALRGLGRGLPRPFDAAVAAMTLERVGDALRLGVPVPREIATWLAGASLDDLADVVRSLREDVAHTQIPTKSAAQAVSFFDDLSLAVTARDRLESAILGLVRTCAAKSLAPASVEGVAALLRDLAAFDATLGATADFQAIEASLGDRRAFLRPGSWTHEFAVAGLGTADSGEGLDPAHVDPAAIPDPPDAVLEAYVHRGFHKKWIERLAASRPEFGDELLELIDSLDEPGEVLSLQALAWRRRMRLDAAAVFRLARPAMAAKSADDHDPRVTCIALGRLDPVDAEAELIGTPEGVRLRVFGEPGQIVAVHLGDASVSQPDAEGDWVIDLPYPATALLLRVVGPGAVQFEMELSIELTTP